MELVLAVESDLPKIKEMYTAVVVNMYENEVEIWDSIYPSECFYNDIKNSNMYILVNNDDILGAFVLENTSSGEDAVKWEDNNAKAVYLRRLGVNPKYEKQGIGSKLIEYSAMVAKERGADYLRLFVTDNNKPAICLYEKLRLLKAEGAYEDLRHDSRIFVEYGFEKRLN